MVYFLSEWDWYGANEQNFLGIWNLIFLHYMCMHVYFYEHVAMLLVLYSIYGQASSQPMREDVYICNIFSHWLRPCTGINRKPALIWNQWWHMSLKHYCVPMETLCWYGNQPMPNHWFVVMAWCQQDAKPYLRHAMTRKVMYGQLCSAYIVCWCKTHKESNISSNLKTRAGSFIQGAVYTTV